ncbi:aspartate aminotransferase family protein [Marinoscillum sp. MHG1-6]|uniref:aspartate aminotransferase family protein n=1 Tax=Marinoscillum sp. MHG1-6 TaxID=2959627 RepID=UPI0021583A6E|nr:aspartate aminotransferase family protein [Marinoscillum sp. MHG1-6]
MNLFNVYPLFPIEITHGQGNFVFDKEGNKYLDLYGGHAVISIGHTHPHYVKRITEQVNKLGFYSNSILNPLQEELAEKVGVLSGREDHALFLCNSGAEANENALKLASFHTGKRKVISFSKGFHGRTSLAVAITDNKNIVAPVNETDNALILPLNDEAALVDAFAQNEVAAVIIEGIQGIGGINIPDALFIRKIRSLCDQHGSVFIADSIQCGYGRSGKFFSHDYFEVDADLYTLAKGMGNGFPIGGVMIAPKFEAKFGMLGTTFGGNHLACAAALAVAEVIEEEKLMDNAAEVGSYILSQLQGMEGIKEVRGRGLMIGFDLETEAAPLRKKLLFDHKIFTGSASSKNTIRLLPSLALKKEEADVFLEVLQKELSLIQA